MFMVIFAVNRQTWCANVEGQPRQNFIVQTINPLNPRNGEFFNNNRQRQRNQGRRDTTIEQHMNVDHHNEAAHKIKPGNNAQQLFTFCHAQLMRLKPDQITITSRTGTGGQTIYNVQPTNGFQGVNPNVVMKIHMAPVDQVDDKQPNFNINRPTTAYIDKM